MAEQYNVMQSLFGFTPQNVERQLYQQADERARQLAGTGQGSVAAYYALSGLERSGTRPLFGQNPQVQQAADVQSIIQQVQASGADLSTPEGMVALAQELGKNPQFIGMATAIRQEAAKSSMAAQRAGAEIFEKTTAGYKNIAAATETPKEDISPQMRQYRELIAMGESPARARDIAYKIKGEGGEGPQVGFDKTGRYTNKYGEVIIPSEMSKNRAGFREAEKLLEQLNDITEEDVKNAKGLDYTSGDTSKYVGGKLFGKTLEAQTKIAASQLLKQIEALPPGSASDADMRAAKQEFPGYSNPKTLASWVNRTKKTLESSLERQADMYGFPRRITSTPPLDLENPKERTTRPTRQSATGGGALPAGVIVERVN